MHIPMRWLLNNRSIIGIALAIGLAWIIPEWGEKGGYLRSEITTKAGIFTIFLLQGLVLPTTELIHGMSQWKTHAFIQILIYLLPPLVTTLVLLPFLGDFSTDLLIGFAFLAFLPTTVATAVVYSVKAGGNFSIALCNTTLANVGGIILIPIAFSWVAIRTGGSTSAAKLLLEIFGLLLFPLALGQLLRQTSRLLREWVSKHKGVPGNVNSFIIYYIVYCVFSQSVADNFWTQHSTSSLLTITAITLILLILIRLAAWSCIKNSGLAPRDKISAFFCATQKTFGVGVPLAQSIFAHGDFNLVLILLPLMIYHPLQLALDGIIANKISAGQNTPIR